MDLGDDARGGDRSRARRGGGLPRLEVVDATVRFGARTALEGVDLDVAPREVVAVLGPSGSGKSTLLRAITGLQPLDRGTVRLDGRDQRDVPVHRRGIGLMFQDHALFPHRDVGTNVAFGLRMQGQRPRDAARRVGELLELVGLPGAARRAVQELSGGEQQRVALARALAPAPRLLLLDEPLGALDRTLRERLVHELRRLFTDLGLTVVAVTHDQGEAFAMADRIVVVDEGRVLQAGPPAEVWRRPTRTRVAVLLGLTNVGEGTARGGTADTAWGPIPVPGADDGPVALVVPPTAIAVADDGPLEATVLAARFRGAHTELELEVAPGVPPLRAEVPSTGAPPVGARLRLRIDGAVVVDP
jgi:thiamine transport system ATP-binding protein